MMQERGLAQPVAGRGLVAVVAIFVQSSREIVNFQLKSNNLGKQLLYQAAHSLRAAA